MTIGELALAFALGVLAWRGLRRSGLGRRFRAWLARDLIDEACRNVVVALESQREYRERHAYAAGQQEGRQEMWDKVVEQVDARMKYRIGHDFVTPEDLRLAKKGLLH